MHRTSFETVCKDFRVKGKDNTSPYTHTLLTGGKYNFSDDDTLGDESSDGELSKKDFSAEYFKRFGKYPTVSCFAYTALKWWFDRAKADVEGVTLSSRRSDPYFFMYFDLDFIYSSWDPFDWQLQQREIASYVHTTVSLFFPGSDCEMTVAVTEKPRVQNPGYKVGMHFYFPKVVVTFCESMKLYQAVLLRVRSEKGERNLSLGENSWSTVFDAKVYRNGLRDCLTYKTQPCPGCGSPYNKAFVWESMYKPLFLVNDADGVVELTRELCESRGYILGQYDTSLYYLTRIRCSSDEVEQYSGRYRDYNLHTLGYIPSDPDELKVSALRENRDEILQYPTDVRAQRKFQNFVLLTFSTEEYNRIEACVRENFDESRYRNVQVRSVYGFFYRDKGKTVDVLGQPSRFNKVKITLKGDGSRYCFNKGDHHHSNTAYFEVAVKNASTRPVMEQRCWSPHSYKSTGAIRICERFRSGYMKKYGKIPCSVLALLFHNKEAQQQVVQTP